MATTQYSDAALRERQIVLEKTQAYLEAGEIGKARRYLRTVYKAGGGKGFTRREVGQLLAETRQLREQRREQAERRGTRIAREEGLVQPRQELVIGSEQTGQTRVRLSQNPKIAAAQVRTARRAAETIQQKKAKQQARTEQPTQARQAKTAKDVIGAIRDVDTSQIRTDQPPKRLEITQTTQKPQQPQVQRVETRQQPFRLSQRFSKIASQLQDISTQAARRDKTLTAIGTGVGSIAASTPVPFLELVEATSIFGEQRISQPFEKAITSLSTDPIGSIQQAGKTTRTAIETTGTFLNREPISVTAPQFVESQTGKRVKGTTTAIAGVAGTTAFAVGERIGQSARTRPGPLGGRILGEYLSGKAIARGAQTITDVVGLARARFSPKYSPLVAEGGEAVINIGEDIGDLSRAQRGLGQGILRENLEIGISRGRGIQKASLPRTETLRYWPGPSPMESLTLQLERAGRTEPVTVSAAIDLFPPTREQTTIFKPGREGLERGFFIDPVGRLRSSRLGILDESEIAGLYDFVTGDIQASRGRPQAIVFRNVLAADFPEDLARGVERVRRGGAFSVSEQIGLTDFLMTPTGQFKAPGYLSGESELFAAPGNVLELRGKLAETILEGRRVPVYEAGIRAPSSTERVPFSVAPFQIGEVSAESLSFPGRSVSSSRRSSPTFGFSRLSSPFITRRSVSDRRGRSGRFRSRDVFGSFPSRARGESIISGFSPSISVSGLFSPPRLFRPSRPSLFSGLPSRPPSSPGRPPSGPSRPLSSPPIPRPPSRPSGLPSRQPFRPLNLPNLPRQSSTRRLFRPSRRARRPRARSVRDVFGVSSQYLPSLVGLESGQFLTGSAPSGTVPGFGIRLPTRSRKGKVKKIKWL